jgi:hypothetical protein
MVGKKAHHDHIKPLMPGLRPGVKADYGFDSVRYTRPQQRSAILSLTNLQVIVLFLSSLPV